MIDYKVFRNFVSPPEVMKSRVGYDDQVFFIPKMQDYVDCDIFLDVSLCVVV